MIPARGDKLTVAGMPFNNAAATQAEQEIDLAQREHTYLNAFYILLALILAFLVLRYVRKSRPQLAQSYAGGVSVEDLLADKRVARRLEEEQGGETQQVLEQLRALAKSKPEETLVALRSWLTGD